MNEQPKDYAIRVDFEVRLEGDEIMIYKRVDGQKPRIVYLTIPEWEIVKAVGDKQKRLDHDRPSP